MNDTASIETSGKIDKLHKKWENKDNRLFYESVSIEANIKNSILAGLENGFDLDLIYPEIQKSTSILEVGAGYGRVIKYLLDKKYKGQIVGIERSKKLCEHMRNFFLDKAQIIHADLNEFESQQKFDLILWMFSGISDFPKNKQLAALSKLSNYLNPRGQIILDVFRHDIKPENAITANNQSYVIQVEGYSLKGYLPSTDEITEYAEKLNLCVSKMIPYETPTHSKRFLYILSNRN